MNDFILSGLLNLFALFSSDKGLKREDALELITCYLKYSFGLHDIGSYVDLYSDLRSFYDDSTDLDRETIIESISSRLQGKLPRSEQCRFFCRIMEFTYSVSRDTPGGTQRFDRDDRFFLKLADCFGIDREQYGEFVAFVTGKPSDRVLVIDLENGAGVLRTLYLNEFDILLFSYEGERVVLMNDIPVRRGVFQEWQQSGVLKCSGFTSMYYSTIMAKYKGVNGMKDIQLCGRHIEFRFDGTSDNGIHDFSFNVSGGQLVAIMGGSGVGKSTLLSLLNGTLKPRSGSITVNGWDLSDPGSKSLIGYVPQDDLLIEELTVYQNLWYTAKFCFDNIPDEELDGKVVTMLSQLGLLQTRDLQVGSPINKFISGGQRKRLNIALELIREPAVLFLDEPTSGLSSTDTENIINLLKEQAAKGRLIIANIHQPSSDVYKLFDRLWLLDKGGYPVYDGNPIEALSYFKTAAEYADAATSVCPVCGNIKPETMLNIINEQALDASGRLTDRRKVSPAEWHGRYLSHRPEMEEPVKSEIPLTNRKRPGWFRQTLLFLRRTTHAKLSNLQYVLVTLLEAPVLAAICAWLTHYVPEGGTYTVMDNKNLLSYFFMAVIVAIFLGISSSAEEIIRDRALLKREKFLNLSYSGYITSKIVYMAAVCLVQTFLFIITGNMIAGIHSLFWMWWLILFVSALFSSLVGLILSQCLNSVVTIYISIPLLLIPQILLCGLVVDFDDINPGSETGNVPIIGDVIPSRWAFEALSVGTFTYNEYERPLFDADRERYQCMYYEYAFLHELRSQLETREDRIAGEEDAACQDAVLRTELGRLTDFCGMRKYEGDWSYASLNVCLDEAAEILRDRGNQTSLALDRTVASIARECGRDRLLELKRDNCNLYLEDLVLNRKSKTPCVVRGSHIVPRSGYVFLDPVSRNGRAPFYSGIKFAGDRKIPTLWFNLFILLFMCLCVGACLYSDFPGKYVRKFQR